jgi:hypothetical protein
MAGIQLPTLARTVLRNAIPGYRRFRKEPVKIIPSGDLNWSRRIKRWKDTTEMKLLLVSFFLGVRRSSRNENNREGSMSGISETTEHFLLHLILKVYS